MDSTIEAYYFDGVSSYSNQCKVTIFGSFLELRLNSSEGTTLIWKLDHLFFEKFGEGLEIRNKKYSSAFLKIEDKSFAEKFYQTMKENHQVDFHTRLLQIGVYKISILAFGIFGIFLLVYFYLLPSLAERSASLLPPYFDDQMGTIFMNSYIDKNTINKPKTRYLEQFYKKIKLKNTKKLHFLVLESEEVNAFALPNGQIIVYTGILKKMQSYDELVALLGHEASHINQRHSTKLLCRNLTDYMVISLLFSDVNGMMAVLTNNAQQLKTLSYSRGFEEEADEEGLHILMENNVNPNGMVLLFERLEKEEKISIPKIISTHPLTIERKQNMKKIISKSTFVIKPNSELTTIFQQLKN